MGLATVGHRDGVIGAPWHGRQGLLWWLMARKLANVALDGFPEEKQLAAPERTDVVHALQQHSILQAGADGAGVVVDQLGQLIGGQVSIAHDYAPCAVKYASTQKYVHSFIFVAHGLRLSNFLC